MARHGSAYIFPEHGWQRPEDCGFRRHSGLLHGEVEDVQWTEQYSNTQWPSELHPRNTKMAPHMKSSKHSTLTESKTKYTPIASINTV